MTGDTQTCYDELASHYHLIFEDWEASITRQASALSVVLQRECGPASEVRVLDCACGIGTQALGLAKLGFQMSGCDVSPGAIERAQMEASQRSLDIQLSVANMLDLEGIPDSNFDAVICIDNALPHLESNEQLIQAATQIRSKLRDGGLFVASLRDYDRLVLEKPVVQPPSFYSNHAGHSNHGGRRIVFQVWDWVDDRHYVFHLYITRQIETGWQTLHYAAPYRALLRDELTNALAQAGFVDIRWLDPSETGFYPARTPLAARHQVVLAKNRGIR
jgi:SAM-dependent methyltransferase